MYLHSTAVCVHFQYDVLTNALYLYNIRYALELALVSHVLLVREGLVLTENTTLVLTYSTTCSALVLTIVSYISDRIHSHSFYSKKINNMYIQ